MIRFIPELVTVLWRLTRNGEQRSAEVFTHPHGLDLRAIVDGELLYGQVFQELADVVREADELRRLLEAQRWTEAVSPASEYGS